MSPYEPLILSTPFADVSEILRSNHRRLCRRRVLTAAAILLALAAVAASAYFILSRLHRHRTLDFSVDVRSFAGIGRGDPSPEAEIAAEVRVANSGNARRCFGAGTAEAVGSILGGRVGEFCVGAGEERGVEVSMWGLKELWPRRVRESLDRPAEMVMEVDLGDVERPAVELTVTCPLKLGRKLGRLPCRHDEYVS